MLTKRLLAVLLALSLVGSACGSDDDPAVAPDEDTVSTTTTAAGVERVEPPFEGEAAEVALAYQTFFSSTASDEERTARIEAGPHTEVVLAAAAGTAGESAVTVEVTGVSVAEGAEVAEVEYTLTVGDTPLPGLVGHAVKQEGTWRVALDTLCGLLAAQQAAPDECTQVAEPASA